MFQTHVCPWNLVGNCWGDSKHVRNLSLGHTFLPMKPGSGHTSAWPLWSVWWRLPSSLLPSCSGFLPLIHQRGKVPHLSRESKVRRSPSRHLARFNWWSPLRHGCVEITLPLQTQRARARAELTGNYTRRVSASSSNKASQTQASGVKNARTQPAGTETNSDSNTLPEISAVSSSGIGRMLVKVGCRRWWTVGRRGRFRHGSSRCGSCCANH